MKLGGEGEDWWSGRNGVRESFIDLLFGTGIHSDDSTIARVC